MDIRLILNANWNKEPGLNFRSLEIQLINDKGEKFQPDQIKSLFENPAVGFEVKAVGAYFQHKEAKLNYDQFLSPESIENAQEYINDHKTDLKKAEDEYGVDREVITAILLVETRFGKNVGSTSVLGALSTMAALEDPKIRELFWKQIPKDNRISKEKYEIKAAQKAKLAYNELKAFIKYVQQEGLDPYSIPGSYAGAMGISQFMPSNILALAKGDDQNGHINLFHHEDAILSVANFLKHYGWKPGITRENAYEVVYNYNHSEYYVNTILKIVEKLKG